MTRNPGPLQELQRVFEARIGPYWEGTVGDGRHDYGYHLGGLEVATDDYSRVLPRDLYGIDKYGGDWASAIDVGMGWKASRDWLKWVVSESSKGNMPDLREVVGSLDGITCWEWDRNTGGVQQHPPDHILHTHISFYRDSIFRGQNYLFDTWTETSRVIPTPTSTTTLGPDPSPVMPLESDGPAPTLGDPVTPVRDHLGFTGLAIAAGCGGLAWLIKRRMELNR